MFLIHIKIFEVDARLPQESRVAVEEERESERKKRAEAKQKAKERRESGIEDPAMLTKKEQNRRKLAEARRRDAEKYGEDIADLDAEEETFAFVEEVVEEDDED